MENTKRLFSVLLFSLLICFGFTNCKDDKARQQQSDDSTEHPQNDDSNGDSIYRPGEIIPIAEAKNYYDLYEKRRVHLIQRYEDSIDRNTKNDKIRQEQNSQKTQVDPNDPNGERFDVARYVSWNYDTIKNYLKYIEQEAKAANVEISTLRFYFSNYPENEGSAVHPRQNSIMITPTLHQNDREYIFSIDDSDIKNIKPQLLTNGFIPIDPLDEKGLGTTDVEDKRSHASFFPNNLETNINVIPVPYMAARSVTMNKGNSAPPPH